MRVARFAFSTIGCISISVLSASATSCASSPSPAPIASAGSTPLAQSEDEWAKETWEDRHDTMTFLVLPNMSRSFQAFFKSKDRDLTCETCHGKDPESADYKMPRGLPSLDPNHLPSAHSPDANEARIAAFMQDEVTPTMAKMLGRPLYDPATKKGFSCFSCHPSK